MSHTINPVQPVQGTELHKRIAQLCEACKSISIHHVIWSANSVTIGRFPNLVDVTCETLEFPGVHPPLTQDLYRVTVWRTKETFQVVAIGPGYLLSKISLRGIPLHDKY